MQITDIINHFFIKEFDLCIIIKECSSTQRTTDPGQATGKLYHLRLRVECTLFCNLQSWVQTHAVLVIGSSTTKTGRYDIAEILLKVALSTKKSINQSIYNNLHRVR
jgi:hypothetical protein